MSTVGKASCGVDALTTKRESMGKLDGKVAVITGGASGIGAGTVRLFVQEGARVVIADIQQDRGQALAEELGTATTFALTDVSDEAQVEDTIALAVARFGRLDCMYNNAGYAGVMGPIESTDVAAYDATMVVLLRSVVIGMKHAVPVLKQQGSGSILSTASVAGMQAGYGPHIYSAAKAAIIQLTRTVAMELGEHGVRVNCICPGAIATPLAGKTLGLSPDEADASIERLEVNYASMQPIRRAGQPVDIARAALWLASDEASFVTGQALVVDGGLTGGRQSAEVQATGRQLVATLTAGMDVAR
jgi:NAD(P)-dependent dehydrogenase (short-subunit alcohol dehydrogenase family)